MRKHHQATGTSAQLELSADGAKVSGPVDPAATHCIKRRLSPARASWLYVSQAAKLDEKQRQQVAQICSAHADLDRAYDLTQAFISMLADHRDTNLDRWLAQHEQGICLPLEVESVVMKALAKNPQQRFPSIWAFALALEQASTRI